MGTTNAGRPVLAGPKTRILALMSGTSVDSIDAALCDIDEDDNGRLRAKVQAFYEHPVPAKLRERIFHLFDNGPESLSLACSLNFEIGEAFAESAIGLIDTTGIPTQTITAIASHGQTVWHIPPHVAVHKEAGVVASTLQLGEASVIAANTGLPVVCDFRVADMAAGGNGAPLVPFADYHLFSRPGQSIVIHNIGGISNCTLLPASYRMEDIVAFDTGPGNMVIDALIQHFHPSERYDRDGAHARAGEAIPALLDEWMAEPYITAPPPKTTGRELFGKPFATAAVRRHPKARPNDLIATATLFTARSIARNIADHVVPWGPLSTVFVAGGGAKNRYLMELIAAEIADACASAPPRVALLDETGFSSKSRECVAFALLGHAFLRGTPANVPSATGARRPAVLGKYVTA